MINTQRKSEKERKKKELSLRNLAIAVLMGEGVIHEGLYTEFPPEKSGYIRNYIIFNKLDDYVQIKPDSGDLYIRSHPIIDELINQWYEKESKIFSHHLDPGKLSYSSIMLWVNIYGKRRVETIEITTNVEEEHLRKLSYCIEKHIQSPLIIGRNTLKIPHIHDFYLNSIRFTLNDASFLSSFLHPNELKKLKSRVRKPLMDRGMVL